MLLISFLILTSAFTESAEFDLYQGNVGIKTENAEEALTVHGNVRVTGHIMQPSDKRAKEEFEEVFNSSLLRAIK